MTQSVYDHVVQITTLRTMLRRSTMDANPAVVMVRVVVVSVVCV